MPLLSEIITDLLELQAAIGDQNAILADAKDADIPFPSANGLGIDIIDDEPDAPKRNGQVR